MLELDHVVLHFDKSHDVQEFKVKLTDAGLPFEPSWGKKAKGFQISNIWIGRQYLEIVDIHNEENLWQPEWSRRHAKGERGVYCIFFKVNGDIKRLSRRFSESGLTTNEPERTSFKWFFGLFKKTLPWQFVTLPKMPGTDIEIGFIEYDLGAEAKFEPFMKPNSVEVGVMGIEWCLISSNDIESSKAYLSKVSSAIEDELPVELCEPSSEQNVKLLLTVKSSSKFTNVQFSEVALESGRC